MELTAETKARLRKEKNQPMKRMARAALLPETHYYLDGRGDLRSKRRDVMKQAALYFGIKKKKKIRRWLREEVFKK